MYEDKGKYDVVVSFAGLTETKAGTVGIALTFECHEGELDHTLWLTPNTGDNVRKNILTLGVEPSKLADPETLRTIGKLLLGAKCSITTAEEEYKGTKSIKVKWINPRNGRAPVTDTTVARAAYFFAPRTANTRCDGDFESFGSDESDTGEPPGGF